MQLTQTVKSEVIIKKNFDTRICEMRMCNVINFIQNFTVDIIRVWESHAFPLYIPLAMLTVN